MPTPVRRGAFPLGVPRSYSTGGLVAVNRGRRRLLPERLPANAGRHCECMLKASRPPGLPQAPMRTSSHGIPNHGAAEEGVGERTRRQALSAVQDCEAKGRVRKDARRSWIPRASSFPGTASRLAAFSRKQSTTGAASLLLSLAAATADQKLYRRMIIRFELRRCWPGKSSRMAWAERRFAASAPPNASRLRGASARTPRAGPGAAPRARPDRSAASPTHASHRGRVSRSPRDLRQAELLVATDCHLL